LQQVEVQRNIILQLRSGKTERSPEIIAALAEAQEVNTQIKFQYGLIEKYRLQLN